MKFYKINVVCSLGISLSAVCVLASQAIGAESTPFTCGAGQSASVVNIGNNHLGIGNSAMGVSASSSGEKGRSGVDFTNINEKFSKIELSVQDRNNVSAYVRTKLCFTDAQGDFTVQKKLSEYRTVNAPSFTFKQYELNASDFGARAAQATLVRLTEVLNTPENVPANVTFGGIWFNNYPYKKILKPEGNGGCASANACDKENDL